MRHAYMICAHNQFELLEKLILMLDDKNNDIFIHIDKKSGEINEKYFESIVKHSKIKFTKRIDVVWGNSSQIEAELILLEEATQNYHDYYHMLTGQDLPIKSNNDINKFFLENYGKEFVDFDIYGNETYNYKDRIMYFYLPRPKNVKLISAYDILQKCFQIIQNILLIDRTKKTSIHFKKGSVYFDVTHDFAQYIIEKMRKDDKYIKAFKYTRCADEVFVQTILFNSEYYKKHSNFQTRYIDWSKHGNSPEILNMSYLQELKNTSALYARKFSIVDDKELVDNIFRIYPNYE